MWKGLRGYERLKSKSTTKAGTQQGATAWFMVPKRKPVPGEGGSDKPYHHGGSGEEILPKGTERLLP